MLPLQCFIPNKMLPAGSMMFTFQYLLSPQYLGTQLKNVTLGWWLPKCPAPWGIIEGAWLSYLERRLRKIFYKHSARWRQQKAFEHEHDCIGYQLTSFPHVLHHICRLAIQHSSRGPIALQNMIIRQDPRLTWESGLVNLTTCSWDGAGSNGRKSSDRVELASIYVYHVGLSAAVATQGEKALLCL